MQTAPTSSVRKPPPKPKAPARRGPARLMVILGLVFFSVYIWLAKQMEGISFDTTFIAVFCTFLSVFIARCFYTAVTGK